MADQPNETGEAPVEQPQSMEYAPGGQGAGGLAIAALVVGIGSIVMLCIFFPLSIPTGIAGIVLGVLARKQVKAGTAGGAGMALAGLICGVVGLALGVLFVAGIAALLGFGGKEMVQEIQKQQMQMLQQMTPPAPAAPAP